jgi:hypothetical protein
MNVQAAYMVCKDGDFTRHAKDEYARWEQGAMMTLKGYMGLCLTKFKTLKMKGLWEAPSPEQEQIIPLTPAVTSLKSKLARFTKSKAVDPKKDKSTKSTNGRGSQNTGTFAWKDVAPKANEPTSKVVKGRTCYWCTHHMDPMWALNNPDAFPNMCQLNPKYTEMEAAFNAQGSNQTAEDIKLQYALAAFQESDSGGEDK